MSPKAIRIEHNIKGADVVLDLADCVTCLVGPPDSGKTAMVQAVLLALTGHVTELFTNAITALVKSPHHMAVLGQYGHSDAELYARVVYNDGSKHETRVRKGKVEREVPPWAPRPGSPDEMSLVPTFQVMQALSDTAVGARAAFLGPYRSSVSFKDLTAYIAEQVPEVLDKSLVATTWHELNIGARLPCAALPEVAVTALKTAIDGAAEIKAGCEQSLTVNVPHRTFTEKELADAAVVVAAQGVHDVVLRLEENRKELGEDLKALQAAKGVEAAAKAKSKVLKGSDAEWLESLKNALVCTNMYLDLAEGAGTTCGTCGSLVSVDALLDQRKWLTEQTVELEDARKAADDARWAYSASVVKRDDADKAVAIRKAAIKADELFLSTRGLDESAKAVTEDPAVLERDMKAWIAATEARKELEDVEKRLVALRSLHSAARAVASRLYEDTVAAFERHVQRFLPRSFLDRGWKVKVIMKVGGRDVFMVGLDKGRPGVPADISLCANDRVRLVHALAMAMPKNDKNAYICLPVGDFATSSAVLGEWLLELNAALEGSPVQVFVTSTVAPEGAFFPSGIVYEIE